MLQHQTGLTKTQILNWLANARRRGKIPDLSSSRTASPRAQSPSTAPKDIPRRPRAGTPAPLERTPFLNPLERWVDSPPEHEPATATAIAHAVASSSPLEGTSYQHTPGGSLSGSSRHGPSPSSSVGTSRSSNGSSGSAYSFDSQDSTGPFSSMARLRQRRKRRAIKQKNNAKTPLTAPLNTFQCTFCTETFSTKHTWQRHEKSLHLALERWVCAPHGPRSPNADGVPACVFCYEVNPDDEHIESHNYSACQQRSLEERTFHRKDHLGQHLRLVHNLKPDDLVHQLSAWKMKTPEIISTCGFCGMTMNSWQTRTDHLAEHFKMGTTMDEWKGDWGFTPAVLARLENAMAPYLIAHERNSPFPFSASHAPLESPTNPYELIKLELMNFIDIYYDKTGKLPTSEEIQFDACRIIFAAEIPTYKNEECSSWLRDLILSSEDIAQKAKLSPLRSAKESRLTFLWIIGKENPFQACPFENRLQDYVKISVGDELSDHELQKEACRIIQLMERESSSPADIPASWLLELARSSTGWLQAFRERAGIPQMFDPSQTVSDSRAIDSILQNYTELEMRLADQLENLREHGVEPDDNTLRQQTLKLIEEFPNTEWQAAAAQNHAWLARFKRRHLPWSNKYSAGDASKQFDLGPRPQAAASPDDQQRATKSGNVERRPELASPHLQDLMKMKTGTYFLNDPNFDRWVARELARWVAATMSPHNPNQHIPTDEELQHQARWIMYEDGDPFNQTMADNGEWLKRFKRDIGLLEGDGGPGLCHEWPF